MKKKDFDRQLFKRLEENKKLTERQFLPKAMMPFVAWVSDYLFWVMIVTSFLVAVMMFGVFGDVLFGVSRKMLFLQN